MTNGSKLRTAKGKVVDRGHGKYQRIFIYVPKDVFSDTAFPFKVGQDVDVEIKGDSLVIRKRGRGPQER